MIAGPWWTSGHRSAQEMIMKLKLYYSKAGSKNNPGTMSQPLKKRRRR